MTFIEYIKTQGYELIPLKKGREGEFSTMGNLYNYYKKGDVKIAWGLGAYGKPPTLLKPIPYARIPLELTEYEKSVGAKYSAGWLDDDDFTNRILQSIGNEEMLKRIETNNLKFDLSELKFDINELKQYQIIKQYQPIKI
jgi:hypothetical protein